MAASRAVDRVEMELVNRGEGFFHVGCAGHEASAALNAWLGPEDWLHLHYRDKALMIARGLPLVEFFHGLLCTAPGHSAGRQMSAHLSAPSLNLLSLVGPVGNNALQSAGVAHEIRRSGSRGLVVCGVGDGASQQGEFLEAVAEAVRAKLPVLFLVEDNRLAISTTTRGRTFYDLPSGPAAEFYGVAIRRLDGRDPWGCHRQFGAAVAAVRNDDGPAIVVLDVERLTHHTNADDERVYRDSAEIERVRQEADPIAVLKRQLIGSGVSPRDLEAIEIAVEQEARAAADVALHASNPEASLDARPALPPALRDRPERHPEPGGVRLTMLEAMRETLRGALGNDPRVTVFGEDVEDPKGDVFGLTRGLSTEHPGRVINTALSESTIAGLAAGRALAGGRPVGCLQFADFVPLAFNQIAAEIATLHWRSNGGWSAPVILLAPCGGYRPGLGPFHAQTFDTTLAHVPGLDVYVPGNAADAAGLLNAAFATGRPTVVLYPKVCLNDPALGAPGSAGDHYVPPGKARRITEGGDLTIVTWGGTTPLCRRVADTLRTAGVETDLWDLRSLSPWDSEAILASAGRTGRLLVVHEDNLTAGFGAEIVATVAERSAVPVRSTRVARPDTHIPCNYVNQLQVLPDYRRILDAACTLTGTVVTWSGGETPTGAAFVLEAVGSSPADQTVSIVEWKVREGDKVEAGNLIADCEADKASFELRAPVSGVIRDLRAVDDKVPVGSPLATILRADGAAVAPKRTPVEQKPALTPFLRRMETAAPAVVVGRAAKPVVGLSAIAPVRAARLVTNEEMASRFPGRAAADIFQRTGIETRRLLGDGESALTLATGAAQKALSASGLGLTDIDAIWVSTSTPISISPSMACLLHHELARVAGARDIQACDVLAACTGWLYALQAAFDFCQSQPKANVLVVTAEAMSRYTDPNDFDTAIVFADAATATLVHGAASPHFGRAPMRLHRPVLSARGEDGSILNHGRREHPEVNMDGLKVFPMAVRQLIALLKEACATGGVAVEALDYIIPHQANGRILEAVDSRLKLPKGRLLNLVRHSGNTSSSTIPLAIADLVAESTGAKGTAGLCAFGGGFTFGAALLEFV
jgi:2-oxoisovalerate dehydrogenase E1 component